MELYLRLKPSGSSEQNDKPNFLQRLNDTDVKICYGNHENTIYKFDKILGEEASQQELFEAAVQPVLHNKIFKKEQDSCFFTIGPSNSGKSYSIFGNKKPDDFDGVVSRSLYYILNKIGVENLADFKVLQKHLGSTLVNPETNKEHSNPSAKYGLTFSMFELYDDSVRDLLSNTEAKTKNIITTDLNDGKLKPSNLSQIYCINFEKALELLTSALRRRKISKTNLNPSSSRFHCFIYINVIKLHNGKFTNTRFTIVDLAGLERMKINQTPRTRLKEFGFNNNSLLELKKFLELFKQKKFDRSVLRSSKLNRLLFTDILAKSKITHDSKYMINVLTTLDPISEESAILQTFNYINPIKIISPKKNRYNASSRNNSSSSSSSNSGSSMGSNSSVNSDAERNNFLLLEIEKLKKENNRLNEEIIEIEVRTRESVANHYEQAIEEINKKYLETRFQDDENNQLTTDLKLDNLAKSYQEKFRKIENEHEEKVTKLNEEIISLGKKLSSSQIENNLYNDIKRYGLENEVQKLIESKLNKDPFKKPLSPLTSNIIKSPLKEKSISPQKKDSGSFLIFSDNKMKPSLKNKRRVLRKTIVSDDDDGDIEM
ncbi:hypothetical protein PACTADRAFT_47648 [Pachysolen tannophilus NRRL Y-2460]|uniref:Kinesin motor domain-containing protein n=1 Tax=Pachysolen tannophilus NRRL Y-2460 TaxID=669874 RepID=A0A1E4U1A9_PACTA|nr:hypothetical protein PACTADRAFT_47648 [Pachysolen tannophilus NRRL Y-2460]